MKNKMIRFVICSMLTLLIIFGLIMGISGCDKFPKNVNNSTNITNEATEETIIQHQHVFKTTVFEAACEVEGYTLYECSCGHSEYRDEVPMLLHDFETKTVEKSIIYH